MTTTSDVVVIGAGAYGTSVAYSFAKRGQSVTLLDAANSGKATSASAGGLWAIGESLGLGCGVIFHTHEEPVNEGAGPQPVPRHFMEFLRTSSRYFPELANELGARTGMNIEAESGTGLFYLLYDATTQQHAREILNWLGHDETLAQEWGRDRVLAHDRNLAEDILGAVYFPGDNQVNPMFLTEAYKRAAIADGMRFVAEARVVDLCMAGDQITTVRTTAGDFSAGIVVNAAGAWAGQLSRLAGASIPLIPVRGQIVCTETLKPTLTCNLSTIDCYIMQKAHGEVLIGSTTEMVGYDTSVTYDRIVELAKGAVRAVPGLEGATIKRTWAGLRPGTPDELPILGREPSVANLHYCTGGFRTGIVSAPLSGEMVAAAALGERTEVPIDPYLASRFDSKLDLSHFETTAA